MKKYIFIAVVILLGTSMQSKSQTVDEVINKYVEAYGGMEKLNQLKTIAKTGVLEKGDQEIPLKLYLSKNTGFKLELEINTVKNYELANSKEGVIYFPSLGHDEVLPMPDDMYKLASLNLNILPLFINYAEKNNTAELKGVVETDAGVAYKLEVTTEAGEKIDYFIDNKSGYLIKTIYNFNLNPETAPQEITFSDFRVIADKYIIPFKMVDDKGTIQFTSVEVNVPLKESEFKP